MGHIINNSPGYRLRQLRERLGFSLREVENATAVIATHFSNPDFAISLGRLSDIESKNAVPNIYKLFSLSLIYRMDIRTIFAWYGMDLNQASEVPIPKPKVTYITDSMAAKSELPLPTFDPGFSLNTTSNVGRLVQEWGHFPLGTLERFASAKFTYGYIGQEDYTMYPLLPPGSFVQVDETQTRISTMDWVNEYERPIYFVETRVGYVCCWCSLPRPDQIVLEAHPLSHVAPRVMRHPQEAEVIGRVVGVAMRLEVRAKQREALRQSMRPL
jgi:transcriptional regulator with XRE-family HTH domain